MVDGAEDCLWIFTKKEEIQKWAKKELLEEDELIITRGILLTEEIKTKHHYFCVILDEKTLIFETEEEAEKTYGNNEIIEAFYIK